VPERTAARPAIFVGDSELLRGLNVDVWSLPRDAFIIRSFGDVIVIAGRDDLRVDPMRDVRGNSEHGTIFGVYEFLERFVGVRFYFPGDIGTVVPPQPNLRIPCVNLYEEPDCDQRRDYPGPEARWFEPQDAKEKTRTGILRSLRHRVQTFYIPCCHGLSRRCLAERFGAEHPEWFALLPNGKRDTDMSLPGHHGHLCYRDPGLLEQIYRETEAYLLGVPAAAIGMQTKSGSIAYDHNAFQPGYVDLCPQDGLGETQWCQMPDCKRFWDEGKQNELVWGMVVDIANRLKKNGIPGYVTCFAYGAYREAPAIELPDNVLVELCISGPWDDQLEARRTVNDRLIQEWNAKCKGGKIWLWNYMSNYNGQVPEGVPPLSCNLIEQYYRRAAPNIRGAFNESEIGYWLFNYLNYYVFHKMMWNAGTDVKALVAEHHQLMFGGGAEPMAQLFARLESIWTTHFLGQVLDTPEGPIRTRRNDREVWDEIFTAQVMAELAVLVDQAEQRTAAEPESQKRVQFFREKFLGEMLRVRAEYADKQRGIEDLVATVRPLPAGAAPVIDGKLDDACWAAAQPLCLVPLDGDKRLVQTEVRTLWTPGTLYIGFDCEEPHPDTLYLAERPRDDGDMWKDASVEVFLNPSSDRRNYVQFVVNANGVVTDYRDRIVQGTQTESDRSWNCNVRAAATRGTDRWQVELAIPVSEIADTALAADAMWVVNFCRSRNLSGAAQGENQLYTWSPFLRRSFHDLPNMGRLRFAAPDRPDAKGILDSGSFEPDLKSRMIGQWYLPNDPAEQAAFAQDSTYSRDGRRSLRITHTDPAVEKSLCVTQYLPDLQPGKRYLVTFWVRAEKIEAIPGLTGYKTGHWGGFANSNFGSAKQNGNNNHVPTGGYRGSFDWTKAAFVIEAPAQFDEGARPYVRMYLTNATGTVWYDDVRIRELTADGQVRE